MEEKIHESLKGQLLIAMPELPDPFFFHSVSLIFEHDKNGAVGLILNKVHPELTAKHIFNEIKIECSNEFNNIPIYLGGPVNQGRVYILHEKPFGWKGTIQVSSDIAITNTLDIMYAIAKNEGPEKFLLIIGNAGWTQGQLEKEIMANAWLHTSISEEIIFDIPAKKRWEKANLMMGINPGQLSSAIGHA